MTVMGFFLFMIVSIVLVLGVLFIVTAMILDSFKLAIKVMKQELVYLFSKKKKKGKQKSVTKKNVLNFIDSCSESIKCFTEKEG